MHQDAQVVIRFKNIEQDDAVRSHLEQRLRQISHEFPETSRCELSLSADSADITAHAHASGKQLDLAAHAARENVRAAGEVALDKLVRELRRQHDKRIFARRRAARRNPGRREMTS